VLVLLEVLLVGVRGLSLALEIIGVVFLLKLANVQWSSHRQVTYDSVPALVCSANSIRFSHEIGTLLIVDGVTA
jgi:hypothetical protein